MLDLTGIVVSSVMMLLVIVRAIRLDRTEPWFQTIKRAVDPKAAARPAWKRKS